MISEGAEAKIYSGKMLGIDVIVKDRIKKPYRIAEIDNPLRHQRTRTEAKILFLASSSGLNVPSVLLIGRTTLTIKKIDGIALHKIIDENTLPPKKLKKIISSAGTYAAMLHDLDISHGDLTPANMMVDKRGGLWIIDFGLAEMTPSIEEKALDLLLMKRSISGAMFNAFLDGYKKKSKRCAEILPRLNEIERRGRYQTRTLLTG